MAGAKKPMPKKQGVKPKDHSNEGVNVSVEVTNNLEKTTKVKKGVMNEEPENNPTSSIRAGQAIVGLSKGYSINLGNYESAKVSCWISRVSNDDETAIMDNLAEISGLLDEQLEFEIAELGEKDDEK
jgi:hypothetical protein